jgi:TonB family protein
VSRVRPRFRLALAAAVLAHAAAVAALWATPPAAPAPPRRPPTRVTLVAPRAPAPAPRPRAPEPERPRPPEPPRTARLAPPDRPPPPPSAAAPATPAPAPSAPPPPRRFAVSMDATVPGGGVAVPTTPGPAARRGDPLAPASAPVGDLAPADATEVERLPRLVRQPGSEEMRALYPEGARRDGLEADVKVQILVGEDGAVRDVRAVGRAGSGFDDVAQRLSRRMAFEPARRGGRAVPVWITWTWKFRLD